MAKTVNPDYNCDDLKKPEFQDLLTLSFTEYDTPDAIFDRFSEILFSYCVLQKIITVEDAREIADGLFEFCDLLQEQRDWW